jgi:hypothetical protein
LQAATCACRERPRFLLEGDNRVIGLGRGDAEELIATMLIDFRERLRRLNRVLRRLREAKLVTIRKNVTTIHDVVGLHRIAYPLLDVFERASPDSGASPPAT